MMTDDEIREAISVAFGRIKDGDPALVEIYRAGYAAGQAVAVGLEPVAWRIDYHRPCAGDVEYLDWRDLEIGEKMEDRLDDKRANGHDVTPLYDQAAAVPREPTQAMIIAGISSLSIPTGDYVYDARDVWRAMYDAALRDTAAKESP